MGFELISDWLILIDSANHDLKIWGGAALAAESDTEGIVTKNKGQQWSFVR